MSGKNWTIWVRLGISLGLLVLLHFWTPPPVPNVLLYLVAYLAAGADVLWNALRGIWNRQPFDENFLMAVATVGAWLISSYAEGVAVMLFYQIGSLFEAYAVGKSRRSITALMDIRPDYANLETPEGVRTVSPAAVPAGSTILVKPGERIPLDGSVLEGSSSVDVSALTGESVPQDVGPGDAVQSGGVNLSGALRLRTETVYAASTVAQILELVENSALKKARTERAITKFARWYTPGVCISALLLALLPPAVRLLLGEPALWTMWLYRALTFLVISCPCALVISVPLTFFGGIGGASKHGILVKGANDLERLAAVDRVVFDKTGTLTQGVFELLEVVPSDASRTGEELLRLAASAGQDSDHPVSQSLRRAADTLLPVSEMQEIAGCGVQAVVGGVPVAVGNARLMERLGVPVPPCGKPGTLTYVTVNGAYAGYLLVGDRVKPTAAAAVAALRQNGVRQVSMVTGDRRAAAESVGRELGLDAVCSEMLPADKVGEIERMLEPGHCLAFVGDGVNDAPVLARADVGAAMGGIGSDAAVEAADLVLMDDDPRKLGLAIRIARRTMRIVRQNIVFAIAVKLLCLLLGALGMAGMWAAVFADVGVMVLCVLNAARALAVRGLS